VDDPLGGVPGPSSNVFVDEPEANTGGTESQISVAVVQPPSAVPLPPALFLLAAALAGLIGFARFGTKTVKG
jgi:hypothetical protein